MKEPQQESPEIIIKEGDEAMHNDTTTILEDLDLISINDQIDSSYKPIIDILTKYFEKLSKENSDSIKEKIEWADLFLNKEPKNKRKN